MIVWSPGECMGEKVNATVVWSSIKRSLILETSWSMYLNMVSSSERRRCLFFFNLSSTIVSTSSGAVSESLSIYLITFFRVFRDCRIKRGCFSSLYLSVLGIWTKTKPLRLTCCQLVSHISPLSMGFEKLSKEAVWLPNDIVFVEFSPGDHFDTEVTQPVLYACLSRQGGRLELLSRG